VATGGTFSIPCNVNDDTTTTFYATATDAAGNTSACSTTSVSYVEDSTSPAAPTLTSTSPGSPANQNVVNVVGTAEPNSTVRVYPTATCAGVAFGTGTASGSGAFSVPVTVGNDTSTTFRATATDAAGNASACSTTSVTYVEDSTPPTFGGATAATTQSNTDVQLDWTAATDTVSASSAIVYEVCVSTTSGACGTSFAASRTSSPGATSLLVSGLLSNTTYFFVVRAKDQAGNADGNVVEVSATTLP
jgi:Big-like domain-containing protein/fibronectin type III domain protein